MDKPIEIFFSYAHEDEDLMNDVRRQLIVYERNGRILKWHDRMIPAGAEWRHQIDFRLESADIILLFVSPHFIESRYCYEVEGTAALGRHASGEARVVPIILRPCAWQDAPFGSLQALPRDARPISRWEDRDEACLDAARGVMVVVDELVTRRSETRGPRVTQPVASRAATDELLTQLSEMHASAKRLSLTTDRDRAFRALIDHAIERNRPELAVDWVQDLSFTVDRDHEYKKLFDALIDSGSLKVAADVADKLSTSIDRDELHKRIIDAGLRR